MLSLVPRLFIDQGTRLDIFWTVTVWMPLWKASPHLFFSWSRTPEQGTLVRANSNTLPIRKVYKLLTDVDQAGCILHKPNPRSTQEWKPEKTACVRTRQWGSATTSTTMVWYLHKENAPSLLELIRPHPTVRKHDNSHSRTVSWLAASWWQLSWHFYLYQNTMSVAYIMW